VRSAFAVGHSEAEDQVEVDMEYHKQMLALHLKANPREVLVGWYATASELNTFSALIQNFYSGQGDGTWPHPAVHLTVSTEAGKDLETRAYISAPVGVTAERAADSAAFIPVPYELRYGEADKSGLEAIANAKDAEERSTTVMSDVEALESAIEEVLAMIDRVSRYVESVIDEETPASTAMGQFLLNALALAPKVEPADIERDLYVSSHIPPMTIGSPLTDFSQQQPHPGRPGRLLLGQHRPHTDGAVQPASNRSTYSGWRRGHRYLWRGEPAQPARWKGWSPAAPGARCPRGGPRIRGHYDGKMMHDVTNFSRGATTLSVDVSYVSFFFLPYFRHLLGSFSCLSLSTIFHSPFPLSYLPCYVSSLSSFPPCKTGQIKVRARTLIYHLFLLPAFLSLFSPAVGEPRAVLV
jgi:translation initiation factor 3 subunit F